MDSLHSIFQAKLVELVRLSNLQALVGIVEGKAKKKGIVLSKNQLRRLRKKIEKGELSDIKFRKILGNKDNSKKIEIKISKDEIQLFKAKNKAIRKTIPKIIEDVSEISAKKFSSGFRNTWRKSRNFYKKEQINFEKNNFKVWGKPLANFEFLIFVTEEFGYLINEASRGDENREDQNVIEALTRLFARICQVSFEVLTLLKHGFAGGAMARWRTIHELVVISSFIMENGEDMATRYFLHNDVESYKAAIQYQKYWKALGYKPFSKKELNELTVLYESAISKFGTSFKESYG